MKSLFILLLGISLASSPQQKIKTGPDPELQQAWYLPKFAPTNCRQIVVAVVDTGIDYDHPELRTHIWYNAGENGPWSGKGTCHNKSCNQIDDDGNGFVDDFAGWDFGLDTKLPYDVHGHGTHIAGIISSSANNGEGARGICPGATIMPLKFYGGMFGYENLNNTVRAIQYAVKMGARIINYSGGGSYPARPEKLAIEEARRKGILVVAAAGNDGQNTSTSNYYPQGYGLDNIIGVASLTRDGKLAFSSNYGPKVSIAAPGIGIFSSLPEGKYGTKSGTSQATAIVSGAAALLWSVYPKATYHQIRHWLIDAAKPSNNKQIPPSLDIEHSLEMQAAELAKERQEKQ